MYRCLTKTGVDFNVCQIYSKPRINRVALSAHHKAHLFKTWCSSTPKKFEGLFFNRKTK